MIETRVQGLSKMSGKRNKSGQKSPGHVVASADNLAEKERADRIAAAEAMSCLSSVILLSSDLEKETNVTLPPKVSQRGQKRTRNSQKSAPGNKTTTESKRGKSRSGRGRGARSANHGRGASTVRPEGNSRDVDNVVDGVTNNTHEDSRVGGRLVPKVKADNNLDKSAYERTVSQSQGPVMVSAPPRSRQGGVVTPPSNSNQVTSIPNALHFAILSKLTASGQDHKQTPGEHLVLKLPLVINNDSTEVKSVASPPAVVSPAASTDSVEFTQSTVEKLLQPPSINKFDSLESALPLKKRKLLSYTNSTTNTNEESVTMVTSQVTKHEQPDDVVDLTTVKAEPEDNQQQHEIAPPTSSSTVIVPVNVTPVTSATLNPVSVDPRTSLMLLTEMQMALQQDEDGDLPLHIAVAQENIVMVQKFVHLMSISGKSVDKYNKAQQTPLHLAVELNFVDAVKTLLLARANPNLVNKRGENAVHLAVKVRSSDCLDFMIQHSQNKIDLDTRNFEGLAPLHTAVEKNNLEIVDMLLRAGADINILDGKSGKTPLFYAVEHNLLPMIEFLLSHGANVDLANYAGITVVMAAQARGHQEAATLLLKGMDSQAYHEMKESTPTKKIPIPRIPSKSHLIVNSENLSTSCQKNYKMSTQNSDSNSGDSLLKSYQGVIAQHLTEGPLSLPTDIKKERNSDNRQSEYRLINLVQPSNLLNGRDQPENLISQSQTHQEVTMSDIPRQVSPATVSTSGPRRGYESKSSTSPLHRKANSNVKQISSLEDIQSSQSSKPLKGHHRTLQNQALTLTSHHQSLQNQAVTLTSQTQISQSPALSHESQVHLHKSQALPTTSRVQSPHDKQASSIQIMNRTQHPHHKSPPDSQDNPEPVDNKQLHVENLPHKERLSHHHKDGSSHTRDSSPIPRDNSVFRSDSSVYPLTSNSQSRETSQHLMNSSHNLHNSSSISSNSISKPLNSSPSLSFHPGSSFHPKDNSIQTRVNSPHQRDSSPYRSHQQKRIVKVNSSGKMHVERAGSGSKGQSSGSSKGSMPSSQMYHLTNISRSTKDILAAKLQGIYTSKAGQTNRPLNLSTGIPDNVNVKVKEET
ncbi:uncharacterized protein LOC132544165 [Ylistrum balloti]|uniref:uncharacterized protein LOC132544165 n=1 Tax=Ylistrum balloti TaxID=509963 RepID=UPI0029059F5A|nr:uncharacterized protein LOC132544165 [Ylistrum balloti]